MWPQISGVESRFRRAALIEIQSKLQIQKSDEEKIKENTNVKGAYLNQMS